MNRLKFLKHELIGTPLTPQNEQERLWQEWSRNHNPLLSPSIMSFTERHLNHFCVGSDPEFMLRMGRDKMAAYSAGLKVGLAAGCDQNERLVELRPYPSVSVMEHVTGILSTLRWLRRTSGNVVNACAWRAGGFWKGDSLGGHVHFGRKRPTRTEEVAALDGLARVLKRSGLFPVFEWDRRIQGDDLNQHYGAPGDFRKQQHGYEYRSLPSWLQSPTTAFISICSSKLAVLDPSITTTWKDNKDETVNRQLLRGLAKLFKSRDDDAYVLYHLLTCTGDNVFLVDHEGDFAPAWGLANAAAQHVVEEEAFILPACICPEPEEVVEMQNHLLNGAVLEFKKYPPRFRTSIPPAYQWLPRVVNTGRRAGFGDLIHNLVKHSTSHVNLDHHNGDFISVNGYLPSVWSPMEHALLKKYAGNTRINSENSERATGKTIISVPRHLCQAGAITGLRAILTKSGLFPLWTVDEVQEDSFAKWLKTHTKTHKIFKGWRTL